MASKIRMNIFQKNGWIDIALNLVVAVLYIILARIGLCFALNSPNITIFWPAGGFALAILLLGGRKFLPGIFIGGVVAGFMAVDNPWVATMLGVADTLESFVAFRLLTHSINFRRDFDNLRDFFKLTLLAGFVASAISALIGPTSLLIGNIIPSGQYMQIVMRWWMGDALGIAFLTPLILIWSKPPGKPSDSTRLLEMVALFVSTFLVGQAIFFGWFHDFFVVAPSIAWIIPFIIWAGLRAGRHKTSVLQLMLFIQALWSASNGIGHYADDMAKSGLVNFWMFGMVMAIGGMAMAVMTAENRKSEQALREKEYLLSESQRFAGIGSWSMAANDENIHWTDETYRLYGVTPDAFVPTVVNMIGLTHPDDRPKMQKWTAACLAGEQPDDLEFRTIRKDGSPQTLLVSGDLQYAPDGSPLRIIGTVQNITERKRNEHAAHESEVLFRMIAENVRELIAVLDPDGRRIYISPSYRRIFGEEVPQIGADSFSEIHPEDRDRIKAIFRKTVATGVGERTEYRFLLRDGSTRRIESEGNVVRDGSGKVSKVIVVSRDVTDRKQFEEQILYFANYDALTDLPNRRLFSDRLRHALAAAKRDGTQLAVLFIDLDMFKPVNDTLGHDIGDLLLKEVAVRLRDCLRESDSAGRLGGDEFVVMLPSVKSERNAMVVAEKIRSALYKPFDLAGHSLHISSSIGIAIFPENGSDDEELLRNADQAMYSAKESGRNTVKLFSTVEQQNKD